VEEGVMPLSTGLTRLLTFALLGVVVSEAVVAKAFFLDPCAFLGSRQKLEMRTSIQAVILTTIRTRRRSVSLSRGVMSGCSWN